MRKRYLREFFPAIAMSVLLHGCTTWTLSKRPKKKFNRKNKRILPTGFNKSQKQQPTKQQIYDHLPPISQVIKEIQAKYTGCCWKSKDELISDILLWTLSPGHTRFCRPAKNYIHQLCFNTRRLAKAMDYRDGWWEKIKRIHTADTLWWWWGWW